MGDLDELKKLTPEERVQKLKEIEERNKKEIEEAQKLMTESMRQIEAEEEWKRDIPIPQLTSVDVDTLFGGEEKEMFKTKRFESGEKKKAGGEEVTEIKEERTLEESVARERPKELPPDVVKQYIQQLEKISSRIDEFKNMDEQHIQQYKDDYSEELSQMYDNVQKMQQYAGVQEQVEKMHLSEQIGDIGSMFGYKRGGV